MKLTILGCGGSTGVPMIGGRWGDCNPDDPRNARMRPSLLVEEGDTVVLVDSSPDLRAQCLLAGITRIDAVLYTHMHADHVHGIDDLRSIHRINGGALIDAYATPADLAELTRRFSYLFQGVENPPDDLYRPILVPHSLNGAVQIGAMTITPFSQDHGICVSTGFRFGNVAYSTDVVRMPAESMALLHGLDVWIVDCLRDGAPHPTHANLEQVLAWVDELRPKRTILTHMNTQTDFAALSAKLPAGIEPAHDGLVVTC